mmetsp:Transcript_11063/g.20272  ORF Transcript_11063/g.20272 Transcript_11063/m.20272 type:complete len:504 (+) Transcript_11063:77-1588(+)|eukprot:CAMPEP_0201901180 /NCGR_PEP_ID=MMETSP0902-20130614/53807_1 /ASSEMBLY_ACC=CAM_ASM_000551 /TAXON_ID=420261 /ORGANISM="Thalassiosira antarctica, Strain CCMP982" /LENGTH=503 /DNA_ID=CAMNT_0048435055 /DNA_START=104 /DNA_END=1615 /DNA_ORIENTATION=-
MSEQLKPLCGILDNVLERLVNVECKLGITPTKGAAVPSAAAAANTTAATTTAPAAAPPAVVENDDIHPRLAAYDEHMTRALTPFTNSCTALGSEMDGIGNNVRDVWNGVRLIVELGTNYKKPSDPVGAIQPHLKPCQDAMASVRSARLDRKFDWHLKAIMEMLACVSWVVMTPPPAPCNFVKDTIGASDFWANKVRKEYKNKGEEGEMHAKFCDAMKALVLDLSAYLKEYHLSGLAWNPHGRDFSDAKVGESGASANKETTPSAAKAPAATGGGGGIFAELQKKQTGEGDSAATGLKKVSRDQQTWRKEFQKQGDAPSQPATAPKPAAAPKFGAKKPLGPPKCEYQTRGCKWNVENQTKDTCEGGVCKVTVTDPKQQVYIYKCQNVTIQITGKLKSVVLDDCTKCGVVFDTAISACEVVNCKSVQVQATNVCPSFAIDKTDGIVIHLTNEAIGTTSFVTSKSSEMNVSWPDDEGEVKEAPIPEQFMHKLVNGKLTSQVSDLYH